jgi:hypothetical protein
VALRLAKSGWWSGDPQKVLDAPISQVMAALQYDAFLSDYERAVYELNKEKR